MQTLNHGVAVRELFLHTTLTFYQSAKIPIIVMLVVEMI